MTLMARKYLAKSLDNLFNEIDARWPDRDRRTDGWFTDQRETYGHNRTERGLCHAIDVDDDGIDEEFIMSNLYRGGDVLWYWIWDRKLYSRKRGFEPVPYTGPSAHTDHMHIEIHHTVKAEDYNGPWGIAPPPSTGDPDMAFDDTDKARLANLEQYAAALLSGQSARNLWDGSKMVERPNALAALVGDTANTTRATEVLVRSLVDRPQVDPFAFVQALIATPEALSALYAALDERLAIVPTVDEIVKATLRTLRDNVLSTPQNGAS